MVKRRFTCTETVGLLGMGAQDDHLDFHTAPEICEKKKKKKKKEGGWGVGGRFNALSKDFSRRNILLLCAEFTEFIN